MQTKEHSSGSQSVWYSRKWFYPGLCPWVADSTKKCTNKPNFRLFFLKKWMGHKVTCNNIFSSKVLWFYVSINIGAEGNR